MSPAMPMDPAELAQAARVPFYCAIEYLNGGRVRPWTAARIASALIAMGRSDLLRGESGRLVMSAEMVDING